MIGKNREFKKSNKNQATTSKQYSYENCYTRFEWRKKQYRLKKKSEGLFFQRIKHRIFCSP